MGQNKAQRQIFQKTKVKFRLKNGPRIGVLEPKIGQNDKKQDYFKPELEF